MKKNRSNFGYYIKEGVSSIFTRGFMSFASVCITVACLIVMGSFSLVALNVNEIIRDFEEENIVLAFVDETYTDEQAAAVETKILNVAHVVDVKFISKEDAYSSFTSKYEDSSLFADLDATVLRDRYAVYLDDVEFTADVQHALKNIEGIANVSANLDIAEGFITARNIVGAVSLVLVAILVVVSLFIMSNTVKLTTFDRREEIAIMKMVGATNSFIRWPFVFQGFILGMLGSLIAFVAQWGVYELVSDLIAANNTIAFISVVPFAAVSIPLLVIFLIIGFAVGVGGSALAIKNYLKV